jgi:hypothetical protein
MRKGTKEMIMVGRIRYVCKGIGCFIIIPIIIQKVVTRVTEVRKMINNGKQGNDEEWQV